jgi:hypothetical protein
LAVTAMAYALTGYEPSFSLEDFKAENERTEVVIYLEPRGSVE